MPPQPAPILDLQTFDNGRLGGKRAVVVEDDYNIRQWIEGCLRSEGAAIVPSFTRGHDVAVLDVRLGHGVTSVSIAETLADRGVPFLFYTGYRSEWTARLLARFEDCPILGKPASPQELLSAVIAAMAWKPRFVGRSTHDRRP